MRKFKLIKEYPNSPTLGCIFKETPAYELEYYRLYPEFWEEVIEFEIESFKSTINTKAIIYKIDNTPYYGTTAVCEFLKDNLLTDSKWIIHSIKRLSDGVIFTTSDEITTPASDSFCSIYGFDIINDKLEINHTHAYLLSQMKQFISEHTLSLIQHTKKDSILDKHVISYNDVLMISCLHESSGLMKDLKKLVKKRLCK